MHYYRLWVGPDGIVNTIGLHLAQVMLHLLVSWLTYDLACGLTSDRRTAWLASLLVAVFPFSQQAVAWAGAHQPLASAAFLAALATFRRFLADGRRGWLGVSVAIYGAALLAHETAAGLVVILLLLAWYSSAGRRAAWAGIHLVMAGAFVAWWWHTPRLPGITGWRFEAPVLAYLLQAIAFPIARLVAMGDLLDASRLLDPNQQPDQTALLLVGLAALFSATWFALAGWLAGRRQGQLALLATLWTGLALVPAWATLSYDYVQLAPRLAYAASPAIALLWASAAVSGLVAHSRLVRGATAVLTLGMLLTAAADVVTQNRMYAIGAAHLTAAEEAACQAQAPGRVLLVNFPDRYRLRRAPYPLGYWGITLAPVVAQVRDFARTRCIRPAATTSLAVPPVGDAARQAWPYVVDMRGQPVGHVEVLAAARGAEGVYLSDYLADGQLALVRVGRLVSRGPPGNPTGDYVADFSRRARLLWARIDTVGTRILLTLGWQRTAELAAEDTVFVHLLGTAPRPVLGADGDTWAGLLPLAAWPLDMDLEDVRRLELDDLPPGTYRLTVGLYNRRSGERFSARRQDGQPTPNNEVELGRLRRP